MPVNALAVLALDAEERRYAADLIEDDRRHRILRGAEDSAEQQVAAGRTVPAGFEGWAEENWQGDDYAAAFAAWLRATGRAADPSVEWAVSGRSTVSSRRGYGWGLPGARWRPRGARMRGRRRA